MLNVGGLWNLAVGFWNAWDNWVDATRSRQWILANQLLKTGGASSPKPFVFIKYQVGQPLSWLSGVNRLAFSVDSRTPW